VQDVILSLPEYHHSEREFEERRNNSLAKLVAKILL